MGITWYAYQVILECLKKLMYAKKKYIILFTPFIRDQSENSKYLPFTLFESKVQGTILVHCFEFFFSSSFLNDHLK